MTDLKVSERPVRDLVAQADRYRRARAVKAHVQQMAMVAAGVAAVAALLARLFGWAPWLGAGVLLAAAVGVGAYAWWAGRVRPTSDAMASRVDADAGLSGELRSAHWFEEQTSPDAWAQFHLDHAARRASAVDWPSLYPAAASAKPWLATAALSVLAVALAFRVPAHAQPVKAVAVINAPDVGDGLTPELREKLAALIAQLNAAIVDKDPTSKDSALADLKDLMAKMDPAMAQKLADMLAKQDPKASGKKAEGPDGDTPKDQLDKATEGLPEDAKWAQDNADAKMAQAGQAQQQQGKPNAEAANKPGERGQGPAQGQQSAEGTPQSMAPLMRETAEKQDGKLMMGGGGPMGGDPRAGSGPTNDASKGAAQALLVAQALKKELVEASADALGENVDKEDLRRKTEQGTSSLGFTRAAAPRVEPSRATAPPPVPDARRPLLFNYFIRRR